MSDFYSIDKSEYGLESIFLRKPADLIYRAKYLNVNELGNYAEGQI